MFIFVIFVKYHAAYRAGWQLFNYKILHYMLKQ